MLTIQYSLFVSRSYRSEVSALAVRVSYLVLQDVSLQAGQEISSSLYLRHFGNSGQEILSSHYILDISHT